MQCTTFSLPTATSSPTSLLTSLCSLLSLATLLSAHTLNANNDEQTLITQALQAGLIESLAEASPSSLSHLMAFPVIQKAEGHWAGGTGKMHECMNRSVLNVDSSRTSAQKISRTTQKMHFSSDACSPPCLAAFYLKTCLKSSSGRLVWRQVQVRITPDTSQV